MYYLLGNKALYLILIFSLWPVGIATVIGLSIGLLQTVTQLQEQTLPFGIKLIGVSISLLLLSGWYGEVLLSFCHEIMFLIKSGV
ncbi:type III secretion system export apparatus protein SpaQ [Shigella sonnei]|uniref:type III secretion system export apparatus protein SpaQ n=1 Tax=Shigella sonnei TaxID=624 RepID=UPI00069AFEF2|nr:type III secretion system export apparatus protein SpaQ [Shigella sonnei]